MKKGFFLLVTILFFIISMIAQSEIYFFELRTIFNFVLFLVFATLNKKVFHYKIDYVYLWILISPILGYLFIIGKMFFSHFLELDKVKEVSVFENLKRVIKDKGENFILDISLNKEIGLNSFKKVLESNNVQMKMDFIFKMDEESKNIDESVDRLKVFLKDKNIEVVHYAAVKINNYDKQINLQINKAKKKGDKLALVMNYMDYCKSGLLEGPILEAYKEKVEGLLKDREVEKLVGIQDILRYYKKINEKKEFFNVLDVAIKNDYINREMVELAKEYSYQQDEYEKVQYFEQLLSEGV